MTINFSKQINQNLQIISFQLVVSYQSDKFIINHSILYTSQNISIFSQHKMDLQILDALLKFTKKKLIKKLFQHCLALNYQQKCVSANFSTPIIQNLQQQIQLSSQDVHRLILSIAQLFKIAIHTNFSEERLNNIFSQLEQQLRALVVGMLMSFEQQVKQIEKNRIKQGKQLDIDNIEWNLSTQISNQKGKSNIPIVDITLPLGDFSSLQFQNVKFQMKGEQFQVFFNNLTKIKQTLNDLITQVQE